MSILDGGYEELIVTSSYLPYDSDEPSPSKEVRDIVEHFQVWKKQLIIGCDSNSHDILWWSTDVNPRGECLMEYLVSLNLNPYSARRRSNTGLLTAKQC
jgi:hypothetical protein